MHKHTHTQDEDIGTHARRIDNEITSAEDLEHAHKQHLSREIASEHAAIEEARSKYEVDSKFQQLFYFKDRPRRSGAQGIEAVSESDDTSLADSLETITTQNAKLKAEAAAQRAAEEARRKRQQVSLLQVCKCLVKSTCFLCP
jgi:hypothetical protein